MKLRPTILILTLATAAFAQNTKPATPAKTPATPAPKPAATTPAKPGAATPAKPVATATAKPAATAPAQKPVTQAAKPAASAPVTKPANAPAKPAATTAAQTKAAPATKPAAPVKAAAVNAAKPAAATKKIKTPKAPKATADKPAETAAKLPKPTAAGRRDPFISPVVSKIGQSSCATGKKCLMVDQVRLQGIVRSSKGMIAMVINAANKTYFLYENDPVFNGYVSKITADSIVFKETTQDRFGKSQTREVVKKVNTPAV